MLPALLLAGWWSVAMQAAFRFAAAFVTRREVAGIATVVALTVGEQLAAIVVPVDVPRLAPIGAGGNLLVHVADGAILEATAGAAVVGLYLVLALAVVALAAPRAEVA